MTIKVSSAVEVADEPQKTKTIAGSGPAVELGRSASNCPRAGQRPDEMKPSSLLIAAAAGTASALLFAGVVLQSSSAVTLALAAPIPIAIASLGWGTVAGAIAAIASALVIVALSGSWAGALLLIVAMTGPAAIAGHLLGLAQPLGDQAHDDPNMAANQNEAGPGQAPQPAPPKLLWYPLDRVLFAIALMATLACLGLGWYFGYDVEALKPEIVAALSEGGTAAQVSEAELDNVAALLLNLVPLVQPAVLTLTLVVGLYLGAWIVRTSGRLPRPKDDLPTAAHLPPVALFVFVTALAVSFLPGTIALAATVVMGAFGMAFTLVGLARLHARSRGRSNRGLLLFASYAGIVILSFPILIFTIMGLADTWRQLRAPPTDSA